MSLEIKKCLVDIRTAIDEIRLFMSSTPDFASYQSSLIVRKAVEREIEIIGEAMARILKLQPSFHITSARRIIDTRNRIIHGYDSVDDAVVYGIIKKHLTLLEEEVKTKLEEIQH